MDAGLAHTLKTYDKLNQRCIPQPLSMTGHPAWGDPVNHPWTTGLQLAYNTEAVLWGAFIEQHLVEFPDGKVNVAALVMNNDFGKAYDAGFKAYLAQSPNKDKIELHHRDDRGLGADGHRPDDHAGRREPGRLHRHDRRDRRAPSHHRGGPERHEGAGQVPVPAVGLRGVRASWARTRSAATARRPTAGGSSTAATRTSTTPTSSATPSWPGHVSCCMSNGIDYKSSGSLGSGFGFAWPMVQALQIAGAARRRPHPDEPDRGPAGARHDEPLSAAGHQVQHERQQGRRTSSRVASIRRTTPPSRAGFTRATSSTCRASRSPASGTRRSATASDRPADAPAGTVASRENRENDVTPVTSSATLPRGMWRWSHQPIVEGAAADT